MASDEVGEESQKPHIIDVSHCVAEEVDCIYLLPAGEGAPKGRMRGPGFDIDPA